MHKRRATPKKHWNKLRRIERMIVRELADIGRRSKVKLWSPNEWLAESTIVARPGVVVQLQLVSAEWRCVEVTDSGLVRVTLPLSRNRIRPQVIRSLIIQALIARARRKLHDARKRLQEAVDG